MTKIIKLTQGKIALVDDEDFDFLNKWKWHANSNGRKNIFYAKRLDSNKIVSMHRVILSITDPKIIVDHKDGDGLNNQRSNLRIATPSQNNANRRPMGSSKYLGVYYHKSSKKWKAQIGKNGTNTSLGYFET